MSYSEEELWEIFHVTDGYCYHCRRKISFESFGVEGAWGAWVVDHLMPLSTGGSDSLQNLVPSCTDCNRGKQDMSLKY